MSDPKPRYDHIDPNKLKDPKDIALYEALVAYVDRTEKQPSKTEDDDN